MPNFKVQVFPRRDRLVRGSEVIHSEEFKTLAGAQKFCKRFKRGGRAKLCNYFFHITGSDLVGWFTVNGAELVNVEDLGIDEELDAQKDEELEALNAQIAEISAQAASLQKQADEIAQGVYKQREVRAGVSRQIEYERSLRPSGFIDSLRSMNNSRSGGYSGYDDGRRSREDRGSGYYEKQPNLGKTQLFRPDGSEVNGWDPD